jgi:hypothetical protein
MCLLCLQCRWKAWCATASLEIGHVVNPTLRGDLECSRQQASSTGQRLMPWSRIFKVCLSLSAEVAIEEGFKV